MVDPTSDDPTYASTRNVIPHDLKHDPIPCDLISRDPNYDPILCDPKYESEVGSNAQYLSDERSDALHVVHSDTESDAVSSDSRSKLCDRSESDFVTTESDDRSEIRFDLSLIHI